MKPGSSGIVTFVKSDKVQDLMAELKPFNGKVYQQKLNDTIVSELAE